MNAPLVCEYLRTHSIADLFRDHAVKVSVGTRRYKASLNYDQIAAKESDPLACECRGLVLATADGRPFPAEGPVGETRVLARPFDRFFNHGQGAAHALDLAHSDTRVFEKLDGTLCIVYHDEFAGEWCVATRAVPDADRAIDGFGEFTFRKLFDHALREHLGITLADMSPYLAISATYCFELTTPYNRIVVEHQTPRVHLLAVRYRNGEEVCPTRMPGVTWPVCPSHPTSDLAALLAFVGSRPPTESEGVVVRMSGFRRVKVKSAAYLAASRLTEACGSSPRALLTVLLAGQDDDVFPLLAPHLRERGEAMRVQLAALYRYYDDGYTRLAAEAGGDRKTLALAAQRDGVWLAPIMSRFAGQCDSFAGFIARGRTATGWGDSFLDGMLVRLDEDPAQSKQRGAR